MYMDLKDIAQKHNEETIRKVVKDKLEYENKKEIITIKVDKEKEDMPYLVSNDIHDILDRKFYDPNDQDYDPENTITLESVILMDIFKLNDLDFVLNFGGGILEQSFIEFNPGGKHLIIDGIKTSIDDLYHDIEMFRYNHSISIKSMKTIFMFYTIFSLCKFDTQTKLYGFNLSIKNIQVWSEALYRLGFSYKMEAIDELDKSVNIEIGNPRINYFKEDKNDKIK